MDTFGRQNELFKAIKRGFVVYTYTHTSTVLHTTVGPLNVYKKSEGQIM